MNPGTAPLRATSAAVNEACAVAPWQQYICHACGQLNYKRLGLQLLAKFWRIPCWLYPPLPRLHHYPQALTSGQLQEPVVGIYGC